MTKLIATALALLALGANAFADPLKLPVESDDKATVYVAPNVQSTEKSAETNGMTIGVEKKDGAGAYGGVDTSGPRPTYSLGANTGGKTSFSTGVTSDGKNNAGVKAGVTIKY